MLMREAFRRWWESTPPSHLEGVLILSYDLLAASFHPEASPASSLQAVAEIPCRNFIFFLERFQCFESLPPKHYEEETSECFCDCIDQKGHSQDTPAGVVTWTNPF